MKTIDDLYILLGTLITYIIKEHNKKMEKNTEKNEMKWLNKNLFNHSVLTILAVALLICTVTVSLGAHELTHVKQIKSYNYDVLEVCLVGIAPLNITDHHTGMQVKSSRLGWVEWGTSSPTYYYSPNINEHGANLVGGSVLIISLIIDLIIWLRVKQLMDGEYNG